MLIDKLVAAFPFPAPPEATVVLYVEELEQMGDAEAAREAMDVVIRAASRWPSLADLHGNYRRAALRRKEAQERELSVEEADPRTPQHAREALRRLEAVESPFAENVRDVLRRVAARTEA
jgi:hypothetical protein